MTSKTFVFLVDPIKSSLIRTKVDRLKFRYRTIKNIKAFLPGAIDEAKEISVSNKHVVSISPWFEQKKYAPEYRNAIYWQVPASVEAEITSSLEHLRGHTIIGSELSPGLKRIMEKREFEYLDLRLSPLRFGSDFFIRVDSNITNLGLESVQSKEPQLFEAVDKWKEFFKDQSSEVIADATIYLQNKNDFATLSETGFLRDYEIFELAMARTTYGSKVVVVLHPHSKPSWNLRRKIYHQRDISFSYKSAYWHLVNHASARHIAYSSSVIEEARFFGVESSSLAESHSLPGFDLSQMELLVLLSDFGFSNLLVDAEAPLKSRLGIKWDRGIKPWNLE